MVKERKMDKFVLPKMRDFSYMEFSGVLRKSGWIEHPSKGKGSHRRWTKVGNRPLSVMCNTVPGPVAKRLLREAGILD